MLTKEDKEFIGKISTDFFSYYRKIHHGDKEEEINRVLGLTISIIGSIISSVIVSETGDKDTRGKLANIIMRHLSENMAEFIDFDKGIVSEGTAVKDGDSPLSLVKAKKLRGDK